MRRSQNWEIDVAAELETYLSQLERPDIDDADGAQQLNFIEAALL